MAMNGGGDRISELPEFVLHRIMMFLPVVDCGRTFVLSKFWNSTRKSYPLLIFVQTIHLKHLAHDAPEFQQRLELLFDYIDDAMRTLTERSLRVDKLLLDLHSIPRDAIPRIHHWLSSALRSGAVLLFFRVALRDGSLYPLPESTFSAPKFSYLITLTLDHVVMSEEMIRDMARNCPNISTLSFFYIDGVKSFEISELYRLESFTIVSTRRRRAVERISLSASNLKIFMCGNCLSCDIDIASSPALECLHLTYNSITDYELNLLFSRFSLLETLDLAYCDELRRIRIVSLPHLKSFSIKAGFPLIESIYVDAPALSSFKYMASAERFPLLSVKNVPGAGVVYDVDLRVENAIVDNSWFVELRKFLARLSRTINLTISFSHNTVSFDRNAIIVEVENRALVEVDCLDFVSRENADTSTNDVILEGLMWICRPNKILF